MPDANAEARRLERRTGRTLPEDTVLRTEASSKSAQRGSVKSLLSLEYRRTTIGIWAIYLLSWIAWFLLLLWLPTALATLALKKSTAALGTVTVNGASSSWQSRYHLLQTGPARSALAMFVSGGVIAILLGLSGANWTLVFILIALAGFGFGGQQLVLNYLIAEAYPTQHRAPRQSGASGSVASARLSARPWGVFY